MKTVMKVYQPREEVKEVELRLSQDGDDVLLMCEGYIVARIKPTGMKLVGRIGEESGLPLDSDSRILLLPS